MANTKFKRTERGPALGYEKTEAKRNYRYSVYAFAERQLAGRVPRCDRKIVILETSSGHELAEAIRRGYRAENIHVVNDSPALLAILRRRFNIPYVQHGKSFDRCVDDLRSSGPFDLVNLDFTSQVRFGYLSSISAAASLLREGGVLAVTFQRGREQDSMRMLMNQRRTIDRNVGLGGLSEAPTVMLYDTDENGSLIPKKITIGKNDVERIRLLALAMSGDVSTSNDSTITLADRCFRHITTAAYGQYRQRNAKVSMGWFAAQLVFHNERSADLWTAEADKFIETIGSSPVTSGTMLARSTVAQRAAVWAAVWLTAPYCVTSEVRKLGADVLSQVAG